MSKERHITTIITDWQGIALSVSYEPDFLGLSYSAHLQVQTIAPAGTALPITETGYRSHFLSSAYVEQAGGPVTYVLAWLDPAAQALDWKRHHGASRQLSLF